MSVSEEDTTAIVKAQYKVLCVDGQSYSAPRIARILREVCTLDVSLDWVQALRSLARAGACDASVTGRRAKFLWSDSGGWTGGASAARLGGGVPECTASGAPRETHGSWDPDFPPDLRL